MRNETIKGTPFPPPYKVSIPCWCNGVWTVEVEIFQTLQEARRFARMSKGKCKIYNEFGVLHYDCDQDCEDCTYA